MNRTQRILAGTAGALALVAATAVFAGPRDGGCDAMGPGMGGRAGMGMMGGRHGGQPAAMAQEHLSRLKADLKITAAQETYWNAFAAQATEQAKAMQAQHEAMAKATPAATAPDRMAQHLDAMKQRQAGLEAAQGALKALYDKLTPEQRAVLDKQGPGGRGMHRPL